MIYRLANKAEHKELIDKSINQINEHASMVIGTEQWAKLSDTSPHLVLKVFVSRK